MRKLLTSLALLSTLIFTLGLVMIFSTTSADIMSHETYDESYLRQSEPHIAGSTHHALIKQVCYAAVSLCIGCAIVKIGYRNFLKYSAPLLAVFTFLLLCTLIPGIGREVNGSKRWIILGGLSLQPSEFVKYLVPLYFIHHYLKIKREEFSFRHFIKLVIIVAVPIFLILIEPNNGTAAVIIMTLMAFFFLARIPFSYWAWPLLAFSLVVGIFASQLPYVTARLKVYLNPELDLKGKGHQPYQAKIAAGSGGLFGKGPGNGLQKLNYLPEAQNDYIAAIFAEEFGFIGILGLICLYLLLASHGFYISYSCPDPAGFYLAVSCAFLIAFQSFLNLGVVSGLLPSTGLNLPLFSQGGCSLMANICGIAVLFSIVQMNFKKIRG